MSEYTFRVADGELYAAYHAIYTEADIMFCDWNERLEDLREKKGFHFLYEDGTPIGGLMIIDQTVGFPFLIEPFCDRTLFWQRVLSYINERSGATGVKLSRMQKRDVDTLTLLGASVQWSQQRMCRPTNSYEIEPGVGFILALPQERDLPEIIRVTHKAHAEGYTSQVFGERSMTDVEDAIRRRFNLFTQTNTWNHCVVAKKADTDDIVGVCIAGVYPDSANHFATIHQVSVLPQFQKRGLAKAMMLRSINMAHPASPVIGLTVLIGNPAEYLYRKLGFIAGPSFTDMVFAF